MEKVFDNFWEAGLFWLAHPKSTTAISENGVVVSIVKKWRFRYGNVYEVREMYNKLEEEFEVPEATVSLSGKSVYLFDKEYK